MAENEEEIDNWQPFEHGLCIFNTPLFSFKLGKYQHNLLNNLW